MIDNGMVHLNSAYSVPETMERLETLVKARGLTILARIDHSGDAAKVGLKMQPAQLLIFGNAKAGTPLMQAAQTMGLDLPLKALVWQDAAGRTWFGYNDPVWLAHRHGADAGNDEILKTMAAALAAVAAEAAGSL